MGLKEESWESDGEQSGQSGWEICPELFLSVSLSVSARQWSHGAAPHHSASVVPLLSSLCSNITFIKMFLGVPIYSHHLSGCTYQKQPGLLGMITNPPYDV